MVLPPGSAPWGGAELSNCPAIKSRLQGHPALLPADSSRWTSPAPISPPNACRDQEATLGEEKGLSQAQGGDQEIWIPV